jgi:hypothetical protein
MLTLAELQASTINPDVAREAYVQADRHLSDLLDVKKSFEQKAATLLGAYITIAVALFGIGGAIFKDSGIGPRVWPFFGAGTAFIIGAWFFVAALKTGRYSAVGSTPEMWLNRGTIDGGQTALPAMLAYITFHHSERIRLSERSNERKASLISAGIMAGPIASLVFLLLLLVL